MFNHAALAARIGIGDHPVWGARNMFGFGLIAILQQRLLVAREVDASTTVQRDLSLLQTLCYPVNKV